MPYEIGDVVRLDVTATDTDGNLADASAVAVAVTQPDGTAGAPAAVANPSTGKYTSSFVAVQAGRHLVRWTGTGPNAFAQADPVNVWPADPRFLIPLADAKAQIGRADRRTARDEDIRLFVAAVTPVIEDITGPLVSEQRTAVFDAGRSSLVLPCVVESASVTVDGVAVPAIVDLAAGVIFAAAGTFGSTTGRQNVVVTYRAGERVIPPNLLLAARREFQFLWDSMMSSEHPGMSEDDEGVEYTPSGFAVPRQVIELCAAHPRFGGFA